MFKQLCAEQLNISSLAEISDQYSEFITILLEVAEISIPKTSQYPKRFNKPWFNKDCKDAVRERKRLLRKFSLRPTSDNLSSYRQAAAAARRTIRQAKRESWRQYVSKLNSQSSIKSAWDRLRKIRGKGTSDAYKHLNVGGTAITSQFGIANALGQSFCKNSSSENCTGSFRSYKNRAESISSILRPPTRSHVGISGNEKADFAAKSALSLPSKWDGEINNKLHAIKPKLGEWALAYRKSRKEESILCRLRVGHTYLTHSFLLRNEAQPVCGRCQLPLTVRHVLVDCAALTSVRSRFYSPPPWEEFFQEPPKSIKAAYLNVSVDKYIPNPLRCFKCQKFGHHQTSCKHEAVCGRCGVANHTDDGCEKTPCCVNCKGKHPSYSRECPNFTLEKKIVTHKYNYNTTFPEARRMVLSLHSPTSYAKVAANNIKKDASTQTHNVGTQTDHVWPITQTSCSASQTVSCEVFPTETKPNNKKKKNDAKITPTVTKPKNKTETQKESAIPLPNKNTNVKTKIKTYERVIKPLTPTQLKTSTESIDFPPMDVIRSAAESQETTSDNGMEVVIPENSPKCKKRGKPPKLPILPPS
ncbi:hypothetical protein GQR58_002025 [Nymphon striatum]|nr:hypothetical protein GQR58_002025 [Nymphon striatum]